MKIHKSEAEHRMTQNNNKNAKRIAKTTHTKDVQYMIKNKALTATIITQIKERHCHDLHDTIIRMMLLILAYAETIKA
jgi:hypothetical protein